MTGTSKSSTIVKLPKIYNGNESNDKGNASLATVNFDTPRDHLQSHRDYIKTFQEKFRGYLSHRSDEDSTGLARIQKIKQYLNKATPYRLQMSDKRLHRSFQTDDTGHADLQEKTTPTMKYNSNIYHRSNLSHSLPDILRSSNSTGFQPWPHLADEQKDLDKKNLQSVNSETQQRKRPKRPTFNPGEHIMHQRQEKHLKTPTVSLETTRLPHKYFGSSSKINPKKTLGDVLSKHGYDTICDKSVSQPETQLATMPNDYHSDKYQHPKMHANVIDSSGYDNFARTVERFVPEEKYPLPRFTPRTNDYSLSRSEMGRCFPVFTSDGSPMRKFGHVHSLSTSK